MDVGLFSMDVGLFSMDVGLFSMDVGLFLFPTINVSYAEINGRLVHMYAEINVVHIYAEISSHQH